MSGHTFHIVDVFAEQKYAGNQLAVVTRAADLPDATMQSIAREMNFSETTFVLRDEATADGFEVRIFTPAAEVPFAGHPTLGTAWVIHREILGTPSESIALKLPSGSIRVSFERSPDYSEMLWMHQRPPEFGPLATPQELAPTLGIDVGEIDDVGPIQQVSTGLPFWIVPLRSLAGVKACRLEPRAWEDFVRRAEARAVLVFARQTYHPTNQINARMFAPHYGVAEDPATGSANGCLAGYLVHHRVLGGPEIEVRVEQGMEIGRPSLLRLRAWKREREIEIFVGGRVQPVAKGTLI